MLAESLHSYKAKYSETMFFIGAGATAALNMPTTQQQSGMLKSLLEDNWESKIRSISFFKNNAEYTDKLVDFLQILKAEKRLSISPKEMDAAKRLFKNPIKNYEIDEETIKNRILELRECYDLLALIEVIKICPDNKDNLVLNCYSIADKLSQENRGIHVENENFFVSVDRFRGARRCLTLLITAMFEIAWFNMPGNKNFEKYKRFFDSFGRLLQKEAIWFAEKHCQDSVENPFSNKNFYMAGTSFVSFNFEIIFLRLLMLANAIWNKHPVYLGKTSKAVKHWVDFGGYKSRAFDGKNLTEGFSVDELSVARMNRDGAKSAIYNRIIKYLFVHGTMNIRECPICGRPMGLFGGEGEKDSFDKGFMPPLPMAFREILPKSKEELEYHKNLRMDSLQCIACGAETFSYSAPMIMQSIFKGIPTSFLEETQREMKVGLSKARHIVLFGYSLPQDDITWQKTFAEVIRSRKKGDLPYCSIVCGFKGEEQWFEGDEIERYFDDVLKHSADYGYPTYEFIKQLIPEKKIRLYAGGIPQIFGEGLEDDVKNLLYPDFVDWSGTRFKNLNN